MRRIVAFVASALVLAASGCSRDDTSAGTGVESRSGSPGVLRIAIEQDVKTLNPILASSTVDGFVQRFLFEPLLAADDRGNPVPMLAVEVPTQANGGISRDGLTFVYHLRPSARWSDGMPVTGEDVKFSWSALMNPDNDTISRHGYDDVAGIETPDAHTVVVHLKRPFAPFLNTFFAESDAPYQIVPAHVLRGYKDLNHIDFNVAPRVSDGPFLFRQWLHGDRLEFVANPHFFLGAPHLRGIEVRVVPNETTSLNLLRTGEIDYMHEPSIANYPTLHAIPGTRVVWVDVNGWEGLGLNTAHPPLDDPRVRRAISMAIDRAAIVRTIGYDQVRVASADIPDWMLGPGDVPRYPGPDVAGARDLLRRSGYEHATLLVVADVANAAQKRIALEVQSMLQAIGLQVEVKYYPADLLYAPAGLGGVLHGGRFDMSAYTWYAGVDPDNSSQFTCAMRPPNGYNDTRYCTPEMEAAQATALTTYDLAGRRAAYRRIESLVARDVPVIPFWWQRQQQAISERFSGFDPNPVCESWNAWQWSI